MGEWSTLKEPPTLLRRMSSSDGNSTNGASFNIQRPVRPSSAEAVCSASVAEGTMLTIKGAASKLHDAQPPPALIDRMQVDELSHDAQAGRKKKKRAKGGG